MFKYWLEGLVAFGKLPVYAVHAVEGLFDVKRARKPQATKVRV